MIMSRYAYSFAVLKSCSGHLYKFREAAKAKATDQATVLLKEIMERVKNATLRMFKMWGTEALILVRFSYSARSTVVDGDILAGREDTREA